MKNCKKIIALLFAVLLVTSTTTSVLAAGTTGKDAPGIETRYEKLSGLTATIDLNSSQGIVSCSSTAKTSSALYSIDLEMELIQTDTGDEVASWSVSGGSSVKLLDKPRAVYSGHTYRVKATATVYDANDRVIETAYAYSNTVTY